MNQSDRSKAKPMQSLITFDTRLKIALRSNSLLYAQTNVNYFPLKYCKKDNTNGWMMVGCSGNPN